MKKTILTVILVSFALIGMAQNNVEKQVQRIRAFYQEVTEMARQGYSTENPIGTAVIDQIATYSAVGFKKGKMEIFTYLWDGEDFDSDQFNTQQVVMIRQTFQRGVWEHYQEFLYDPDTGETLFCYFHDMDDSGEFIDQRFYFSKGKLIKVLPASSASKSKKALNIAKYLKDFGRSVFEDTSLELD